MIFLCPTVAPSPYWFDWVSLGIQFIAIILGIGGAYWISQKAFNKEKKQKEEEEKKSREAEVKLFRHNLTVLKKEVSEEMDSLNKFLDSDNKNYLMANPNLQVAFLRSINIKLLYLEIDFDEAKMENLKTLINTLYRFSYFQTDIRSWVENHNRIDAILTLNIEQQAAACDAKFNELKAHREKNDNFIKKYEANVMHLSLELFGGWINSDDFF